MTKNPELKAMPKEKLTMQAYLLTAINDDERNALHLACVRGSLQLLEYLLQLSEKLNLRQYIINA